MLHTDFHTHTTFCDGKSTPREMVEAAYRMGMTDFGVSGHADFSMFEPGFGMTTRSFASIPKNFKNSGRNTGER